MLAIITAANTVDLFWRDLYTVELRLLSRILSPQRIVIVDGSDIGRTFRTFNPTVTHHIFHNQPPFFVPYIKFIFITEISTSFIPLVLKSN
jgi:hypothetical protein